MNVLLFGATGMVGFETLHHALDDNRVQTAMAELQDRSLLTRGENGAEMHRMTAAATFSGGIPFNCAPPPGADAWLGRFGSDVS